MVKKAWTHLLAKSFFLRFVKRKKPQKNEIFRWRGEEEQEKVREEKIHKPLFTSRLFQKGTTFRTWQRSRRDCDGVGDLMMPDADALPSYTTQQLLLNILHSTSDKMHKDLVLHHYKVLLSQGKIMCIMPLVRQFMGICNVSVCFIHSLWFWLVCVLDALMKRTENDKATGE